MNEPIEQQPPNSDILIYIKNFFADRKFLISAILFAVSCFAYIIVFLIHLDTFLLLDKEDFGNFFFIFIFPFIISPIICRALISFGLFILYFSSSFKKRSPYHELVLIILGFAVFAASIVLLLINILLFLDSVAEFLYTIYLSVPFTLIGVWVILGILMLRTLSDHFQLKNFSTDYFKAFSVISIFISSFAILNLALLSFGTLYCAIPIPAFIALMIIASEMYTYGGYIDTITSAMIKR